MNAMKKHKGCIHRCKTCEKDKKEIISNWSIPHQLFFCLFFFSYFVHHIRIYYTQIQGKTRQDRTKTQTLKFTDITNWREHTFRWVCLIYHPFSTYQHHRTQLKSFSKGRKKNQIWFAFFWQQNEQKKKISGSRWKRSEKKWTNKTRKWKYGTTKWHSIRSS